MSNGTLARNIMEVLSEHGVYPDAKDDAFELRLAIRREIDGHLAAQAEWPSEEDVERAVDARIALMCDRGKENCSDNDLMRAALQSVRPPVGVVSDEMRELYAAASKGFHTSESSGVGSYYTHKSKFHTLKDLQDFSAAWTKAMLASRHAPTKD